MESDAFNSLGIFICGAAIGSSVFALLFVSRFRSWVLNRFSLGSGLRARTEADDAFSELRSEIDVLKQNLAILECYCSEYFHSFQEAGWHSLVRTGQDLSALEASLNIFMRTKRYEEVRDVSLLLLDKLPADRYQDMIQQHSVLFEIVGWRSRSRDALIKLIDIVTSSAQRTKELGVERRRIRKPTLLSLAELRDSLRH